MNNMKSFRTHIFICMLAYLLPGIAISQNKRVIAFYRPGIETHGVSVSVFTDRKAALEGIYTINKDHTRHILTLGYTEHYPFWNVKGLTWYGGAGLHFGYSKHLEYRWQRKLDSD